MATEQELLEMMCAEGVAPAVQNWGELLRYYAHSLAAVSDRIEQDEMFALLAVGGMIFQRSLEDFRAGVDADALFKSLQERAATGTRRK